MRIKPFEMIPNICSVNLCYDACIYLDIIRGKILSIQYDEHPSAWFDRFDKFCRVLEGSVNSFTGSINAFSEMNINLFESELKRRELEENYPDALNIIRSKEDFMRIQTNNILNKIASMSSNGENKKPIFIEGKQGFQKVGIEGQMIEIKSLSKQLSKIAQCLKVGASKGTTGGLISTLLSECSRYDDPEVDLTIDATEMKNYPKTINELLNEEYNPEFIGFGVAIAFCSGVCKIASNVYGMIREKSVAKITESAEKFEKSRSYVLALINIIKLRAERMMVNMINSDVCSKGDSEWWMSILEKIGSYDYEILYCLYFHRYWFTQKFSEFDRIENAFSTGYQEGDPETLFSFPGYDFLIEEIIQCLNDIYIENTNCVHTREDLISYSKIERVRRIFHFYIHKRLRELGICYEMYLRVYGAGSTMEINTYDFIYTFSQECGGYYVGDEMVSCEFKNFKEFATNGMGQDTVIVNVMNLYESIP